MYDFDTVVIGSGAGGLTAALALARAGERVLVLEQHDVPGGWCHSFTLGGHRFSPGVHYLGELGPGGRMRRIYEGLGVAGDLVFLELNPDGYDHALVAGTRFDFPKGKRVLAERLCSRFPRERAGIERYLELIGRMGEELERSISFDDDRKAARASVFARLPTVLRHGVFSLNRMLDTCGVRDPLLRAVLGSQAGDHGLAPGDASAAMHASVAAHYFEGAWYPRGGGFAIPRAFVRALKRHGGELRTSTAVERVLIRGEGGARRAAGVRLADGTEITARRVISNADPHATFLGLVGREHLGAWLRLRLSRTRYSVSSLSLFMAADLDTRALGLDSGNYWYLATTDIDSVYRLATKTQALEQPEMPGLFLTVTTLKDPSKRKHEHTLEAFTFVPYDAFRAWAGSKYGERPESYARLKADLQGKMIRSAERIVPGLSRSLTFAELATPLTNQHYLRATRGNLYGTAKTLGQSGPFAWPLRTEIRDLWMTGASTLGHGVLGATMSGLVAAAAILRCPLRELLSERGPAVQTYAADAPDTWPALMRPRGERRAPELPVTPRPAPLRTTEVRPGR